MGITRKSVSNKSSKRIISITAVRAMNRKCGKMHLRVVHKIAVLFFIGILLFSEHAISAQYFVSPNGNDSNPGNADLPWRTIQKAANSVNAGDVVVVMAGNYNERVKLPSARSGTQNARIKFKADPPLTVYMKGFQSDRNDYVTIDGFNITYEDGGWLGGGIWLDGNFWEIVNNYFSEVAGAGIQPTWQEGRSTNNAYIARNKMYKCNKGFIVSGNNWVVENNEVERLIYYNEDCDYSRFFGENHVIKNNYFHGTNINEIGNSHVDGFQTFSNNGATAKDIVIENNIIDGAYHQGIMADGADGSHDNITIRNNIFMNSLSWGICSQGITNMKIYNNIFANIAGSVIGIRLGSTGSHTPSTAEIKNNIFYIFSAGYWAEKGCEINGSNNLLYNGNQRIDPSSYPNDIVNMDPKFIDPLLSNFKLQLGSPAIDSGIALTGFNTDMLGVNRPQGRSWDIGPYEFQNTAINSPKNLRISPY